MKIVLARSVDRDKAEVAAERVRLKLAQLRAKQEAQPPLVRDLAEVCHAAAKAVKLSGRP